MSATAQRPRTELDLSAALAMSAGEDTVEQAASFGVDPAGFWSDADPGDADDPWQSFVVAAYEPRRRRRRRR